MGALVSSTFSQHVASISLNPGRDEKILAYQRSVENFAAEDNVMRRHIVFQPFVHGSYRYNTAVRNEEYDLDMVLPVDKAYFDGRTPTDVLTHLAGRLRGRYATVSQGKKIVRISHADGFHVDLLPAWAPHGNTQALWIPDKRSGQYIQSHPLAVVEWVNGLNTAACNRFSASVRILKRWRDDKFGAATRPKSLLLTVLAGRALERSLNENSSLAQRFRSPTTPWPAYFRALLESIAQYYTRAPLRLQVPGTTDDLATNWSSGSRQAFENRFSALLRHSEKAMSAPTERGALTAWRNALGASFPG